MQKLLKQIDRPRIPSWMLSMLGIALYKIEI